MKRWVCMLLISCMMLMATPVFGVFMPNYEYISEEGYYYGLFMPDDIYDDGDCIQVMLSHATPDGGMSGHGCDIGLYTKMNGTTYSSVSQLMAAIPANVPVQAKIEEVQISEYGYTNGVSELNFDLTPTKYYEKTFSSATGTFQGLSASTAELPVYYCMVDEDYDEYWYYWPYLDGDHTYDIEVYDYGIVITNMFAISKPGTFYNISTYNVPNGAMTSDIRVACWNDYDITGVCGELYDENGTKLQTKTGAYVDYEWVTTFTDLPAEEGTYTIKLWGVSGSTTVTPVYSYAYTKPALTFLEGTVTTIVDESDSWSQIARVTLTLESGGTRRLYCRLPVSVGDTLCNTVAELQSAMPLGTSVRCAEGDHEYAFQAGSAIPAEPDTYGMVTLACNEGDGNAWVNLALPDKGYVVYGYYLSQDLIASIDDLDAWCRSLEGSCVEFAVNEVGTVIVAMDVDKDGGRTYSDIRYQESEGTFSGLSSSTAELPLYYLVGDGTYEDPVLNEDALYNITVYDYGIVITDMEYVEINVLCFYPEINLDFKQDIQIAYGIWDETAYGNTLWVQLLDARYRVLEEASVKIVDAYSEDFSEIWFRNYPNEDITYHLKLWVTDENNMQISQTYTEESFSNLAGGTGTTEQQVKSGTIVSKNISTYYIKMKVKSFPNGIQTTEYLTFSRDTNVNGKTFASATELAEALPVGTLMEYVFNPGSTVAVIRFSTEKQQVVTDAAYNETEKKVTAKVILKSNDAKEGDTSSVLGTVYAGIYNKEGLLKGITTIPKTALFADGTPTDVPITIAGIDYAQGDYIKVFFWNAENAAISNASTAKIQ